MWDFKVKGRPERLVVFPSWRFRTNPAWHKHHTPRVSTAVFISKVAFRQPMQICGADLSILIPCRLEVFPALPPRPSRRFEITRGQRVYPLGKTGYVILSNTESRNYSQSVEKDSGVANEVINVCVCTSAHIYVLNTLVCVIIIL